MENNCKESNGSYGFVFIGCMFLGWGIGLLLDSGQIGMFLGMGFGFLASGIVRMVTKNF